MVINIETGTLPKCRRDYRTNVGKKYRSDRAFTRTAFGTMDIEAQRYFLWESDCPARKRRADNLSFNTTGPTTKNLQWRLIVIKSVRTKHIAYLQNEYLRPVIICAANT